MMNWKELEGKDLRSLPVFAVRDWKKHEEAETNQPISWLRYEAETSRLRIKSANISSATFA